MNKTKHNLTLGESIVYTGSRKLIAIPVGFQSNHYKWLEPEDTGIVIECKPTFCLKVGTSHRHNLFFPDLFERLTVNENFKFLATFCMEELGEDNIRKL